MSVTFDAVWARIAECGGAFFKTQGGRFFTYSIERDGNAECVRPSHSELRIPREHFATAFQLVPVRAAGKLARLMEGPEYVWAILHDPRIAQGDW